METRGQSSVTKRDETGGSLPYPEYLRRMTTLHRLPVHASELLMSPLSAYEIVR
jgi:hypothetical protein